MESLLYDCVSECAQDAPAYNTDSSTLTLSCRRNAVLVLSIYDCRSTMKSCTVPLGSWSVCQRCTVIRRDNQQRVTVDHQMSPLHDACCLYNAYNSSDEGLSRHIVSSRDRLKTWFLHMSRSWLSLDSLVCPVLSLSRVSMSRHVSCLMTVSWLCVCQP